jgi:uncharacterized membrane protein YdjX (TVP38/TMEM64 family)
MLKDFMPASSSQIAHAKWKVLAGLVACVALGVATRVFPVQDLLQQVLDWIRESGMWGPVIYIGLYVLACVCLVPGSVLTLGAGAIFGVLWGCLYTSVAATLGATAAFLVGRYLARDWVTGKLERHPAFATIDRAVAQDGWKIVGLTRLSPLLPFNLLNYGFGLTRVSLRDYVLATWVGITPGMTLYVYLGSLAQRPGGTRAEWVLYGVGLLATVAVTVVLTRLARRALAKKIADAA